VTAADADTGPLEGVRVLEFGHFIAGPFCTQTLADQGADVIKVEAPGGRRSSDPLDYEAVYFHSFNRNKRSVTIDP